jgi:hypothetical protein
MGHDRTVLAVVQSAQWHRLVQVTRSYAPPVTGAFKCSPVAPPARRLLQAWADAHAGGRRPRR